ncbi:hypothetical protein PTSG_12549 [Salpingoeca rosetta]|uniref:Uncharacterized protein n=1 Tax=Salpingoeca rosetta (strain ATCC 50818 / BSB-021) TaxID=946362 RepID=F2UEC2_SALR5|nr:uncharacterized protein PTSG_12549 [Salpingoeca rosetta]EGD74972.1 hypothetical protein PTSG_12549 [Salpingoeca rosetta]|eukprot:XP_004992617.1 hypothetical protein PTSG_12549 [Salpingoeca rosetta]
MQREERRQQWEEQMEAERNQPRGPIHYETVRAGEIRNLGTGYFAFSKDEIERGQQRELLEQLREETQRGRSKREKLKQRRERALQARLAKIRQRRGDGGAPPSKSAKTQQDAGASQQQAERDEAEEKEAEVEAEEEEEDIDDVLDALMPSDD